MTTQETPPALRATLIGSTAILMWATLALLTTATGGAVPPFQLTALAFSIAFGLALLKWLWRRESILAHLRQPLRVWLVGVGGLFGFHFFYFVALQHAPPVEASLICYLWPLLIVVFSGLLPGERLRWWHLFGALSGLLGTALLVTHGGRIGFHARYLPGYLAALAAALTWSTYSVLSRRLGQAPTDAVGGFCGVTALLAFACHLLFEPTVWPHGGQWLAVFGLGLGPVGAAFFVWDYGVKQGNIRALGALSYASPLLSTLLLIAFGKAQPTLSVLGACLLIVLGGVFGSLDVLKTGH